MRKQLFWILIFALCPLSLFALEVGVAAVKITPTKQHMGTKSKPGIWLAGYQINRPARGVHDDIWARTMVFTDGKQTVVLCSLDNVGVLHFDHLDVRQQVARRLKIPVSSIVIASTHTHSGPDTMGIWGKLPSTGRNEAYIRYMKRQIFRSIARAWKTRRSATLVYGEIQVPSLLRDSQRPKITDPSLSTIWAKDKKGKTIGTLQSYALHPEVLTGRNSLITSDFAHYLRLDMEKALGGTSVFFAGALGCLQAPKTKKRTFPEAKRFGRVLSIAALKSLKKGTSLSTNQSVWIKTNRVNIPMTNFRFYLATAGGLLGQRARREMIRRNFGRIIWQIPSDVSVINIGKIQIISVPGEIAPELGFVLKKTCDSPHRFIIGLANNELGYILPKSQFTNRGYVETMSLGPETAEILMRELQWLITQANEKLR